MIRPNNQPTNTHQQGVWVLNVVCIFYVINKNILIHHCYILELRIFLVKKRNK